MKYGVKTNEIDLNNPEMTRRRAEAHAVRQMIGQLRTNFRLDWVIMAIRGE